MRRSMAPVVWAPCTRVVIIMYAQCTASSVSSSLTMSLLNSLLKVPGSLAMCSLASVRTGRLWGSKLGVGGGEVVIHSNDHPPHGSAGASCPRMRLLIMLATMMKLEKKNMKAETEMNMFHPRLYGEGTHSLLCGNEVRVVPPSHSPDSKPVHWPE